MQTGQPIYLHKLKQFLSERQRHNPAYSMRAFAKDLGIDSSNLSAILKKKRGLPAKRAEHIARRLRLSPIEAALFVSSTHRRSTRLDQIQLTETTKLYLIDEKYFHVIAEWEY
jgi:DNA-binding transcriptional regulator YdaS (Cro superfamily)